MRRTTYVGWHVSADTQQTTRVRRHASDDMRRTTYVGRHASDHMRSRRDVEPHYEQQNSDVSRSPWSPNGPRSDWNAARDRRATVSRTSVSLTRCRRRRPSSPASRRCPTRSSPPSRSDLTQSVERRVKTTHRQKFRAAQKRFSVVHRATSGCDGGGRRQLSNNPGPGTVTPIASLTSLFGTIRFFSSLDDVTISKTTNSGTSQRRNHHDVAAIGVSSSPDSVLLGLGPLFSYALN